MQTKTGNNEDIQGFSGKHRVDSSGHRERNRMLPTFFVPDASWKKIF